MATKKDLVEAYAFSRRRLVTAFVSGAPGGREVEPARPGRTVVAGVALAVLLLAGAAIAGVFEKRDSVDWDESGIVVDADTGALYVILEDDVPGFDEPRLRSVVNVTSAQLILGSDVEAQEVSGDVVAGEPKGPPVGIIGAPATVPGPDKLVNSGWTACTGDGLGVRTHVDDEPEVTIAPDAGLVVRSGEGGRDLYLIATAPSVGDLPETAYSYALPRNRNDANSLASALGVDFPADAITVDEKWLDLFPPGDPLDAAGLRIQGAGEKLPGAIAGEFPAPAKVGDYYVLDDGRAYLITASGGVELTPFALNVLKSARLGGYLPKERTPTTSDPTVAPESYENRAWPRSGVLEDMTDPGDEVCAVLSAEEGVAPAALIGLEPTGDASAEVDSADEDADAGRDEASVMSGNGAVVQRGDWATAEGGSPVLVDDLAVSYRLEGDAVEKLGYDGVAEVVVPDQWLELFAPGPVLSPDAALCPPTTDPEARCE
jgi:type VII secretion protein EccB